jgi:RHH-type transcriptional regulator, rel operon repressor / antitoxin RelB
LNEWQIRAIKEGLREADAGNFASDEEVEGLFKKFEVRAG